MQETQKITFAERMKSYRSQIDDIAATILEQMKQSKEPWEMSWSKGLPVAINAYTGKQYGGNNMLILWNECIKKNYKENKWATFYQWRKKKLKIKRGEKGTLICFAIPVNSTNRDAEQLNLFDTLNPGDYNKSNTGFKFRFRYVFNVHQVIGGYNPGPDLFTPQYTAGELVRQLITKSKAEIFEQGDKAYYSVTNDYIVMPNKNRFIDTKNATAEENYYATLLHELIHWTGHNTRCKRDLINKLASPAYAFEELIAELGSAILHAQLSQRKTPPLDHANYLNSWIKVLENDFSFFTEALELARTAIFYLNKLTGIYPDLKDQYEREVNKNSAKNWEYILGS